MLSRHGRERPSDKTEEDVEHRFWERVDKAGPDECWPWKGRKDRDGYGLVKIRGKKRRAHRVAYRLRYRDRPPVIMHLCDNPPCCNPLHLQGGSQKENMRDKIRKDRQARGSENGRAKLTEDQVRKILCLLREGNVAQTEIARMFSVSKYVVRDIKEGRTWRHLTSA